ncbi:MAG: diaminopimelate decarboxylase, partial [Erysipelotrichaceae bacterium]|nr:diaminopimelate decarboxylase [Erysipelotrichaceae bacterium]
PGIEAHTHEYIVTAHVDSKFGVAMAQKEQLEQTIRYLEESEEILFDGFHAHIGSQIFDKQAFIEEIKKLFGFVSELKEQGISIQTLNLGGGFAAKYTEEDAPIPLKEVCQTILDTCKQEKEKYGVSVSRILIEPGRSIVAEAGYTIYTIGDRKQTPNKQYVFVDGGMADNIRPALYQAKYDCVIDGKENPQETTATTVAGKCCESGDILIESIELPACESGDLLVMKTTGAYGYSMASHYNKNCLPAVVFVEDGQAETVIRRETYEDLIRLEV